MSDNCVSRVEKVESFTFIEGCIEKKGVELFFIVLEGLGIRYMIFYVNILYKGR